MRNTPIKIVPRTGIAEFDFAEVKTNSETGQRSLVSSKSFQPGAVIIHFSWETVHLNPMIFTVQIADQKHIDLIPEELQCMNHNCNPNCLLDTEGKKLICLKTIQPGEELNFFYPSTEWDMSNVFSCNCGSENCLKTIRGAKYLSEPQMKQYQFTGFIREKIKLQSNQ